MKTLKQFLTIPKPDQEKAPKGEDPTWAAIWKIVGAISVIALIVTWATSWEMGWLVFFGLLGAFITQGLDRSATASPYQVSLLTQWGNYYPCIKKPGIRFFPLKGFWFKPIVLDAELINQDISGQEVITPDHALVVIPVALNWRINDDNPWETIKFLKVGREQRVKDIFNDIIRERLRSWAYGKRSGVGSWEDVLGADYEASACLLKGVAGNGIDKIPSKIPTDILIKAHTGSECTDKEKKQWQDEGNWKSEVLKELKKRKVKEMIKERMKLVEESRLGTAKIEQPALGVIVTRLYVGDIRPAGELAKTIDLEVKERREREAEKIETEASTKRISYLMKELGMTLEEATQHFRIERNKTTHTIDEKRLSIAPEAGKILQGIRGLLFSKEEE